MEIVELPLETIIVTQRQRQADLAKVQDLAQSIEQVGLLQPIGVVPQPDAERYRLVFGLHRLQAVQVLGYPTIAAYALPPGLAEEEYLLIELQENTARNDLTGAQRKAFAAEAGRLLDILQLNGHMDNVHGFWLNELSTKVGVDRRTLLRWWQEFCLEIGYDITPRQAVTQQREDFYNWLRLQQEEAAAERQRKAEEAAVAQREQHLDELEDELHDAVRQYGWDLVYPRVMLPVIEAYAITD